MEKKRLLSNAISERGSVKMSDAMAQPNFSLVKKKNNA